MWWPWINTLQNQEICHMYAISATGHSTLKRDFVITNAHIVQNARSFTVLFKNCKNINVKVLTLTGQLSHYIHVIL